MGEIDTKPIEPVQVARVLFGEKGDQKKYKTSSSIDQETDKEEDYDELSKDLSNCKVQLEAKEGVYLQAMLKLEHHQKTADELSTSLKKAEVERDFYMEECRAAKYQIEELETRVKEVAENLAEMVKTKEQLLLTLTELKATQNEVVRLETELAAAGESNFKVIARAEQWEITADKEREKVQELVRHISELNEVIYMSKMAAIDAEKEQCAILAENNAEIEFATEKAFEAQEKLEDMKRQLEGEHELENKLLAKSEVVDLLQSELNQAFGSLSSSEKANSDAINKLKSDMQINETENSEQALYIQTLEMELNQFKEDINIANEEVGHLKWDLELLSGELLKARTEIEEIKGRETAAQDEIALLKSELDKEKSKITSVEAAEARSESAESVFYYDVEAEVVSEESENSRFIKPQNKYFYQNLQHRPTDVLEAEAEEKTDEIHENDAKITISVEEYLSLLKKIEEADKVSLTLAEDSNQITSYDKNNELETLKKDLEAAMVKIGEFRTRAEQAARRAESAEKAKAAVEDQLRKWREENKRRKAALAALKEECPPKVYSPPKYDNRPKKYQPLGKILNMKF
ncbi:protein WEAK CHLOROPLAST MOVEMENT UNDER BLUE LIGHT-like 1 [Tripterygium wilfordii]|uniref:Protein WEAK CHLOROPLAST MOVEMENT UNDER BLUE LIGHT-like 1 n=1 Tax=Tripterygium wilfordii TaxID=458696 RepID=A0A7J7CKT4_TRIWF|nr:protein WEAK CHLOROPLAST MOVEMENT UNDER BLUE LIGHT 1-like [Tripterygium wilfordii]KAF5734672.1 protein WEAK CHLOROPLAST MOVEMENT UNDER BLUE LIGHT-like 1 [Tripterygium wilfordii]